MCAGALLAVCALGPVAAAAQAPADTLEVSAEATFLRDAPEAGARVLTRLTQGTRVVVLDRSAGDWWRVRAGDPPREGYVHRLVLAPPRAGDGEKLRRAPDRRATGVGLLVFAGAGLFVPTARDAFDAVGITGNPLALSGGVEATRVYRGLFVRGTVERVSETGERVFLTEGGDPFGLGIPLDVELMPIEATVGWRFETPAARPPHRVVPFVGGGVGTLRYRETDSFADADDTVNEQFLSYHLLGGADVALVRWVRVRFEYRFRYAPDSLGEGGVSAITGDTSLGGSTLGAAVVIGR